MRRLHAVAAHEKFIASGDYQHFRAGDRLKVSEKWTIHELEGGALFYRVDEDGRDEDGVSLISEALISPEGRLERFNVQSFNPLDEETKLFKADYSFHEGYVQIGSKVEGQEREYSEFKLIEGSVIYIKQMLYMGLTIKAILAGDGKAHVFTPQLFSIEESQSQRIVVQELGVEMLEIGRKTIESRKIQIADDVFYWLDEHNIPLQRQYTYEDALYIVRLANYAHR